MGENLPLIEVVDEIGSTNAEMKRRGREGAPHGAALRARVQTAGRGQRTHQVADALMAELDCKGAIVYMEAEHMCMTMRGVQKPGAQTATLARRGAFVENPELEARFFRMLDR